MNGEIEERERWERMTWAERKLAKARRDHCSALVKVTNDFSELFSSHTTWEGYAYLLRLYKLYRCAALRCARCEKMR
jgi:hypothetical protein